MSKHYINPKIEKRIANWLEIRKKNNSQSELKDDPISITISREFGCQGYPLAAALQKELNAQGGQNWAVFDKSLIEMISADHHISEQLLNSLGERAKYLDYIVASLLPEWKSEEDAYKLITKSIFSIAQHGNAIIVGRGAFAITQSLKNCYHYRLIAPLEFRIKTYSQLLKIPEHEAEQIVRENSSNRNNFMRDFYNCFFNGNEFNMIFNNSLMNVETIAQTIIFSLKSSLQRATIN